MNQDNSSKNGWNEYKKMLLDDRTRNREDFEKLFKKLDKLGNDIAALKVKSGIWGAMGGLIPVVIMIAIYLLTKGK